MPGSMPAGFFSPRGRMKLFFKSLRDSDKKQLKPRLCAWAISESSKFVTYCCSSLGRRFSSADVSKSALVELNERQISRRSHRHAAILVFPFPLCTPVYARPPTLKYTLTGMAPRDLPVYRFTPGVPLLLPSIFPPPGDLGVLYISGARAISNLGGGGSWVEVGWSASYRD